MHLARVHTLGRTDTHTLLASCFFVVNSECSREVFSLLASSSIIFNSLWASVRLLCVFEHISSAWKKVLGEAVLDFLLTSDFI